VGPLALPSAGAVYLDTDAIIYSVEKIAPYWPLLQPLWLAAQDGAFVVISSELALLETLVKPLQTGDNTLENTYRALLTAAHETHLMPVDRAVLEQAARLRASTGIKTPDAIHAASALRQSCALFVSNDSVYRRVPGLPVAILDDYLTP
jgi:predicted nucleic acid-binding protein